MIDLTQYTGEPNPWFESSIEYVGIGRAEYTSPKGWIEGKTHVSVDETGDISITMKIEKFEVDDPIETDNSDFDNLNWLLNGRKPNQYGPYQFHLNTFTSIQSNHCKTLKVITEEGVFESVGEIYPLPSLFETSTIRFQLLSSSFTSNNVKNAKYWVMPLSNFIHESLNFVTFPLNRHILDFHPLRRYRIAKVPDDLPHEEFTEALFYANGWNCFIPFEFEKSLGFIEGLIDYTERKEKLLTESTKIITTSVMVGDYTEENTDIDTVLNWLPIEYLYMLSFVSGNLVGIPWIEIRNENGDLVKRIHIKQSQGSFFNGDSVLGHHCKDGIPSLLSNAPKMISASLMTAMRLAVRGSQNDLTLNEKMTFMFVAFDTLTQYYRKKSLIEELDEPQKSHALSIIDEYEKSQSIVYTTIIQDKVDGILIDAMRKLKDLGNDIRNESIDTIDTEKKQELEQFAEDITNRIAQSVRQALQNRRHQPDESEAILLLLQEYNFLDPELIKQNMPDWTGKVSMYRNQLIHKGFFDTDGGQKFEDFGPLYMHLYDILLRIILSQLNYNGEYMRRYISSTKRVSVNWVLSTTPWSEFGYNKF